MSTTIKLKNSVTSSAAPSSLVQGEAAVNITDKKLWVGNAASSPVQFLGAGADITGATQTLSGNLTLSGGTANGVLYLNGSKVATSGSALVFDGTNLGLGVTPSGWATNRRVLQLGGLAGTVVAFNGTSGSGEQFYNSYLNTSATNIYNTSTYAGKTDFNIASAGGFTWQLAPSGTAGGTITFTQAMTLDSSGNLGIGTTSPATKLQVAGGHIRMDDAFSYQWGAATTSINGSSASNFIDFYTNSTSRIRIDSSGNLGLGVTPSAWGASGKALQISGNAVWYSNSGGSVLGNNFYYNGSGNIYYSSSYATIYSQTATGQHQWFIAPSGTAGNSVSFTQAMTLDANNSLLVGTTNTGYTNTNSMIWDAPGKYQIINHSGTSSGAGYVLFAYNGSGIGSISQNGTTGVLYNTSSDARLKNDLGVATESIIDKVVIHDFTWKSDGSKDKGVFAQELHEVKPTAVTKGQTEDDYWQVDYSKLVPDLIIAVQKLQAEVDSLKAQLNK